MDRHTELVRFARILDGIPRKPEALITENTYRVFYGSPEVYVTFIYRWKERPIVSYILERAVEIGNRLGKNVFIVPIVGHEEQFFTDAKTILMRTAQRFDQHIELDDGRVYILISGCHPQHLLDTDNPFLLCDISELSNMEFVGFFSKILDLFNTKLSFAFFSKLSFAFFKIFKKEKQKINTAGSILLNSRILTEDKKEIVENALWVIAEILLVLENLQIQFYGFQWPIQDKIRIISNQIRADPEHYSKLISVRNTLKQQYSVTTAKDDKLIKILFLTANPSQTTRLKLDKEIRAIQQALRQAKFRDRFEIIQHWAVRTTDIQEYLLQHNPDIVHFSGHGTKANEIILESDTKEFSPVSPRALSQLFRTLKGNIRCVVLNACYSDVQAHAIAEHIDCVVGMSNRISDSAAISFASAFYRALGFGKDVRTAFNLGCNQIDIENLGEQDIPQLIAKRCDPDKIIFVKEL